MTKQEIIAALIKGATGHQAKFVNVRRDHLLIALGVEPAATTEASSVGNDEEASEK